MEIDFFGGVPRAKLPEALPGALTVEGSNMVQPSDELLGEPLNIRQVATLIGCSVWTVRQVLLRDGLPSFRSTPNGKITFFKHQVVQWIVDRQQIHNKT